MLQIPDNTINIYFNQFQLSLRPVPGIKVFSSISIQPVLLGIYLNIFVLDSESNGRPESSKRDNSVTLSWHVAVSYKNKGDHVLKQQVYHGLVEAQLSIEEPWVSNT